MGAAFLILVLSYHKSVLVYIFSSLSQYRKRKNAKDHEVEHMFSLRDITYKNIINIKEMDIPSKQITCLSGESGAGKSTLLKMLNIMISPDSGSIFYNDHNINNIDPIKHRRKVVMLAQHPPIFEGSIQDNLQIGLIFSEQPTKSEAELTKALKLVHLSKDLKEDAETLSGGEKQRLALARIYLMEPDVYLLDEPTSALDDETEDIVVSNFIKKVKEKEQSVVLITHSPKVAEKYGDQIITIEKRIGDD